MEILTRDYFEMMVWQWMVLVSATIVLTLILQFIINRNYDHLKKRAEKTKIALDDLFVKLLGNVYGLTLFALSFWIVQLFLPLPSSLDTWIRVFFLCCVYLQIGRWVVPLHTYLLRKLETDEHGNSRQASMEMVVKILSWVTYAILAIMAIDTLPSVDVTTLIATFGIGGIAVAFALQNVLSDFAAAFTIAFDQPFEEGDGIVVDGIGGTVEKIGLKSTRLRSWDGQEIVISNSDLLASRINNYKTMERRRVTLNFGVVYQTTADELARIPSMVQDIIESMESVTYARTHSTVLNSSSIDYETVYYVESADFNLFMDVRHQVNIQLIRRFEEKGIEFAYPTQTVFVEK